MLQNKSKIYLVSFISFALFFVFALMARPRLVLDYSVTNIVIFLFLTTFIVVLSVLNIIKVFKRKKNLSVILDSLVPLLIAFPLFITVTGFSSLFGELFQKYTFLPILLLLSCLVAYITSLYFLYIEYGDNRTRIREDITDPVNRFNRFITNFGDQEWPLLKYVIFLFVIAILFFIYPLLTEQFTIPLGGFSKERLRK